MQTISALKFFYDKETKTFSQELSTLDHQGFKMSNSFILEGKNKNLPFIIIEEETDNEGDIQYWKYAFKHGKDKDLYGDVKIIIFND